nr:DUF1847 domain-containing protein [candidate division Zixibacteria bacterium]
MRYGIPILGDRIAPRCTFADSVLLVVLRRNQAKRENRVILAHHSMADLVDILSEYRVDTLICGGISRESREFLDSRDVTIIENVVGTIDELIAALCTGNLRSGYGLEHTRDTANRPDGADKKAEAGTSPDDHTGSVSEGERRGISEREADCLVCTDLACLRGKSCKLSKRFNGGPVVDQETARMLEASLDISSERERTLCRLSELIYFCLEMRYRRIGVAFCEDLREPAEILVRVLRRFFEVFPVSCKVGGKTDPATSTAETNPNDKQQYVICNPRGQADILNSLDTDLNVIVGICMGADCVFTQASESPVSTLFVKDRSLANNPIGAVYSDYYLKEAVQASARTK